MLHKGESTEEVGESRDHRKERLCGSFLSRSSSDFAAEDGKEKKRRASPPRTVRGREEGNASPQGTRTTERPVGTSSGGVRVKKHGEKRVRKKGTNV